MAPVNHFSNSSGVAKPAPRKGHAREDSWEMLDSHNDATTDRESPLFLPPERDTKDALHPLQIMADRVGHQVEEFAMKVDLWLAHRDDSESGKYRSTMDLVKGLGEIANDTAAKLKKEHGLEHSRDIQRGIQRRIDRFNEGMSLVASTRKEGNSNGRSDNRLDRPSKTTLQDLRQWQSEANTWELLRVMLELDYHDPEFDFEQQKKEYLERRGNPDRYTPESEIWERFLLENDLARERQMVLKWLEGTADSTESDIDSIVEQLEAGAGKAKGTWSHGWLHTREKIKGHKRIRLWDTPVDPAAPITNSDGELLITQLDPDAPTRQRRALEKEDEYHERSLWLTCWEMLRRGRTWKEIREWFEERNESWRAISLGMAYEPQDARTCLGGAHSGALWRRMCFAAAKHGNMKDYERAVYGLLSGDVESVDPVCRTWDDFLYCRYNSLLLAQFDAYLQSNFPDRLPGTVARRFHIPDVAQVLADAGTAGRRVAENLKSHKATKEEARHPMKLIQAGLVGKNSEELLYKLGIALSKKANADGQTSRLIPPTREEVDDSTMAMADNQDALRIMAHVYLILRALGMEPGDGERRIILENVLVGYVDFLRMAGKIELMPVYTGQLSEQRQNIVLGRALLDITNPQEQKNIVELMNLSKVNAVGALTEQYFFATMDSSLVPEGEPGIDRFGILEPTDVYLWPGQRIRKDFVPEQVDTEEETIIRSVEWFMHIKGHWNTTFTALIYVMKRLLLSGRFNAALELTHRLPFDKISKRKTVDLLDPPRAINVMEDHGSHEDGAAPELRRSTRSGSRRPSAPTVQPAQPDYQSLRLNLLRQQSKPYHQMEQLVHALHALSEWGQMEDEMYNTDERPSSELKKEAKRAIEMVEAAMEPLLHPDFLTYGTNEQDHADLLTVRRSYLPELILAYNSALHSAAYCVTRDNLLKALSLSTVIAAEENADLADCFVGTGRMQELVEAFAKDSRTLLVLNERREKEGRRGGKGKKREGDGRTADVWDVSRVG